MDGYVALYFLCGVLSFLLGMVLTNAKDSTQSAWETTVPRYENDNFTFAYDTKGKEVCTLDIRYPELGTTVSLCTYYPSKIQARLTPNRLVAEN